ncbi:hypothetical protein [Pedobacter miscanthi]|jgi:hypothetical protein|uniref:hypothetical protein n=1 Tax=Pedobacter miscanthi TaxID=2259170 RepID=UPI00292E0E63|nr:hypothetical protein [Pedobacter miscanthi]
MKNRKLMFGLVALIGFGSLVTLNAFKSIQKTLPQYQYMSSSSSATDVRNIANWEEVDGSTPSCGTSGSLVCRYEFDGDVDEFKDFIADKTPTFLANNALSKKQ